MCFSNLKRQMLSWIWTLFVGGTYGILVSVAEAGNATVAGDVTSPFPTLEHLAIEWQIEGDDNLNASCDVRFREVGAREWRIGMPLRRVPSGESQQTSPIIRWTNRLSGSLFGLKPGTSYDIELSLHDVDGGSKTHTFQGSTRPEPVVSDSAAERAGGPADLNAVQPGDILLLADGDYGEWRFNRDGQPGKPIVYRSTSGKARFGNINLSERKWVYLEGLHVSGSIRMNGSEYCVVRRCQIRSQFGIRAYKPGMENGCIEDNDIDGIRQWDPAIMGASGDNEGEGIQITGSGNVIRHNRVARFRDCLSHMEDDGAVLQRCNDWMYNDINTGLDDGIEADFALSHCRFIGNRITNCFVGISSQPGLGGPNYFLRNTMYNLVYTGFKLHRFSTGDVILHNSIVKAGDALGVHTSEPFDHALIENNLFVGGKPPNATYGGYSTGRGRAIDVQHMGSHSRIDFNAYAVVGLPFEGKFRSTTFTKFPGVEFERNGFQFSLDQLAGVEYPAEPAKKYPPVLIQLSERSSLRDRALRIPNINDSFHGDGPDQGALEFGLPIPHYGPRP